MNTLYLLRGIPGAGKSTFAEELHRALLIVAQSELCSTKEFVQMFTSDDYMTDETGEYKFDAEKLSRAHLWVQRSVFDCMAIGVQNIIIPMTLTTEKELEPYLKMAEDFEYKVVSLVVENRHGHASVHNVPDKTITAMKNRFSLKL